MPPPVDSSPLASAIALLEQELVRLREQLEVHRLAEAPNKEALVRGHVAAIDEREERLEELKKITHANQQSR